MQPARLFALAATLNPVPAARRTSASPARLLRQAPLVSRLLRPLGHPRAGAGGAAFLLFSLLLSLFAAGSASAAPESHILRIDPRASQSDGAPILTTVVEVVQNKPLNEAIGPCAALTGNAELDCTADALEKPGALWSPIAFPESNAVFTVTIDGTDTLASFVSKQQWGASLKEEGVGTAWLIMIDAAGTMGDRFDEAKIVAQAFIGRMGQHDIVNVMFFNDRSVVQSSKWIADKGQATSFVQSVPRTFPTQGRNRALFNILKNGATDGFKELGNTSMKVNVPMHQALVVLSNGVAGADAASTGPAALALRDYLTKGRFPEDNQALPKIPVPVISIFFPSRQMDEFAVNSRSFMENLANVEIGGLFSIVRDGQSARGERIAQAVRARFDKMWIVKWQVACVAPTITQTFKLFFKNTQPLIAPDASFSNVPVGIDPQAWPLDIDLERTEQWARKNPLYPGGTAKIFGNFCWGGNKQRAELYMIPRNQAVPATLQGGSLEDARNAQRTLIESGMRGTVLNAGDSFVEFELPEKTTFLTGKADKMTARLVVYDNVARRTSPVTADRILTLKASEAPLPYLLIGGIAFGGVVLLLLVVSIFRGGGGKRRGGGAAPPPPRPVPPPPAPMGGPMPGPYPPMGGAPMGGAPMGQPAYGAPPAFVSRATLSGQAGIFTVLPGMEMKAGRDGALCQILLVEPRVSGAHATVKIESGQLFVRDDNSNNGTSINGQRLPPSVWSPVPQGAQLRFGPVEFTVSLE